MARNIPGVIIAPLPEGHGHFDLDWAQFCTVAIEYTFINPSFDRVVHDSYASLRVILGKCRSHGFRRVGLLFSTNGRERTEGLNEAAYWMEQKTTGDFSPIPPLSIKRWNEPLVWKWFVRYKPEVIVTSGAFFSRLAIFLAKRGVCIPGGCSLINMNSSASNYDSGIDQNNEVIGATAARLLIDKINRNDCGPPVFPKSILTPGKWVEGQTFGYLHPDWSLEYILRFFYRRAIRFNVIA